jgi:hypothetical protein
VNEVPRRPYQSAVRPLSACTRVANDEVLDRLNEEEQEVLFRAIDLLDRIVRE